MKERKETFGSVSIQPGPDRGDPRRKTGGGDQRDQLWDRLETSLYLLICHFARKQRVKTRLIKIEKEHML